ncbi:RNA polymerase sigma-70 factor [Niabella pedocola]|uniref:RNA polymerase sigma-70 factor n=1 Tax=Niabella pedocola TaxID=1752077 RepID=A0ABS8PJ42_9BACT|nr:RNA polymerase sigma-70 factor [Niabella pedocola]MCD2421130.1 RNA polymerase sigma-70 factor [Niabella pedocola]
MEREINIDQEFVVLLKTGCFATFSRLYEQYSGDLYLALIRLVKSEAEAEEILQDIFLNLWEKRETLNIQYSIKAYLYRIAENKASDFFRKLKRDRRLYEHIKHTASLQYLYEGPENSQELALLEEAMEILPPQRKKIFYLCKMEGRSYREVSDLLGISTSTINDHIVKATHAIREFMLTESEIRAATLLAIFAVSQAAISHS